MPLQVHQPAGVAGSDVQAGFRTTCDAAVGRVPVVPQDLGRVLLNLLSHAFYAVEEKRKRVYHGFEPEVTVSAKRQNGTVQISIRDNGTGIPPKAVEKIFQTFFTTKPTGEGTGLGLSLSYDINTKGHGGSLQVETKEGKGNTFTILLAGG